MMDFNVVSLKERQDLSDQLDPLSREACPEFLVGNGSILPNSWFIPRTLFGSPPVFGWESFMI